MCFFVGNQDNGLHKSHFFCIKYANKYFRRKVEKFRVTSAFYAKDKKTPWKKKLSTICDSSYIRVT